MTVVDQTLRDLQYGARGLLRTPGVLAVLVACLSIGIGVLLATALIFSGVCTTLRQLIRAST